LYSYHTQPETDDWTTEEGRELDLNLRQEKESEKLVLTNLRHIHTSENERRADKESRKRVNYWQYVVRENAIRKLPVSNCKKLGNMQNKITVRERG